MQQQYTLRTATAVIVANMVGTGVFAALFFQVESVPSASAILLLWFLGGIVALSGGLCYAELSGLFPRSGGEYEYLTKIFHPALGFSAGVCTLIIGFAAPMAGVALNLGNYFAPVLGVAQDSFTCRAIALGSVALVMVVNLFGIAAGSRFQNISTAFKVALILVFIALPFCITGYQPSGLSFRFDANTFKIATSGNFFACLAMLYYAYTGWNASIYMASDVENSKRNLPMSILIGVFSVTAIYLLLNFAFMYACNFEEILAGGPSVGNTVAAKILGHTKIGPLLLKDFFSILFSFALLATLNSFMLTAPSVAKILGKDYRMFRFFNRRWANGSPYVAIFVMGTMTSLFVLLSDIRSLLDYVGFSLSCFASMVVLGIIVMRWRAPEAERPFRAWGYPVTPLLFLFINIAMVYYSVQSLYGGNFFYQTDAEGHIHIGPLSASFITILLGVAAYYVLRPERAKE